MIGCFVRLSLAVILLAGCNAVFPLVAPDAPAKPALTQHSYLKASNTGMSDTFGFHLALSADDSTLAVGAPNEDGGSVSNGDQSSNSASDAGAVYVFARSGSSWMQQAYLKASNVGATDVFGARTALSADGSTLAVAADREDTAGIMINAPSNESAMDSGAVYVFARIGTTWTQQAFVKPSNSMVGNRFGSSLALSDDGATLAVGDAFEGVYVFTRTGVVWSEQAIVQASNAGNSDHFGESVALSGDGSILAAGAPGEDGSATGINGDENSNSELDAGAVYTFKRDGASWPQVAYIKASNPRSGDQFGAVVSLSVDGGLLAVAAPFEDESADASGAVYVFRSEPQWTQQAYLKAANPGMTDQFGASLAISSTNLVVGAYLEDSSATGIDGDPSNDFIPDAGAAYLFSPSGDTWTQSAYIKASNAGRSDVFGASVAIARDGTVAIGGPFEDSGTMGVDGVQVSEAVSDSGAAYVFEP